MAVQPIRGVPVAETRGGGGAPQYPAKTGRGGHGQESGGKKKCGAFFFCFGVGFFGCVWGLGFFGVFWCFFEFVSLREFVNNEVVF